MAPKKVVPVKLEAGIAQFCVKRAFAPPSQPLEVNASEVEGEALPDAPPGADARPAVNASAQPGAKPDADAQKPDADAQALVPLEGAKADKRKAQMERGNAWKKKLRGHPMPPHVQEEWDRIQNLPARGENKKEQIATLQEEAIAETSGDWTSGFFERLRTKAEVTEDGSAYEWMSWHEFSGKQGVAVAMEQIANKAVMSKFHPGLDEKTTKLKFPETHMFKYVSEKGCSKTVRTDTMIERQKGKGSEEFEKEWQSSAPVAGKKKAAPVERTAHQLTMAAIRAGHSYLENRVREYDALIKKTEGNPYVEALRKDLKVHVANAKKHDASLKKQESEAHNGKELTKDDLESVKGKAKSLVDEMDLAKKLKGKMEKVLGPA